MTDNQSSSQRTFVYDGKVLNYQQTSDLVKFRTEIIRDGKDERMKTVCELSKGEYILDFGCNIGRLSKVLAENGHRVLAMDRLNSAIEIAKEFSSDPLVEYTTNEILNNPKYESAFDCIVFAETLEHVNEPFHYLNSFHNMLKTNGILIISTPNATSIKNMFYTLSYRSHKKRMLLASQLQHNRKFSGTQLEHLYAWDFVTLIKLLDVTGFDFVEERFTGGIQFKIPKIGVFSINNKRLLKPIESLKTTQIIKAVKRDIGS